MNKACQYCLKEFQPFRGDEVYCFDDCRKKGWKELNHKYSISSKGIETRKKYIDFYRKAVIILRKKHKKQFFSILNQLRKVEGGSKHGEKEKTKD